MALTDLTANTTLNVALVALLNTTTTMPSAPLDADGNPIPLDEPDGGDESDGGDGRESKKEGTTPPPPLTADDPMPTPDQFPDMMTYAAAMQAWQIRQQSTQDEEPEEAKNFSSVNPFAYAHARQFVIDQFFGGETQGKDSLIRAYVNAWALRLTTPGEEEGTFVYPSLGELVQNEGFRKGAAWLPYSTIFDELLPIRQGLVEYTDKQGQPQQSLEPVHTGLFRDAEGVPVRVTYTPVEGLKVEDAAEDFFGEMTPGTFEIEEAKDLVAERPELIRMLDPMTQAALTGNVTITTRGNVRVNVVPKTQDLNDWLGRLEMAIVNYNGGRPSGGGRQEPKIDFDRRLLSQQAEEAWRSWLFEQPTQASVNTLVDDYIREATGFWSQSGGRILSYEAFVKERLRSQPRHKMIYRFKPEDIEEPDFINAFASPISRLGLRPGTTQSELVNSMMSGGSPIEQVQRIQQGTREGFATSNFSERFASTLASLGPGGR